MRNEIETTITPSDGMLQDGHALQQIRTSYTTAVTVQRPRDLAEVKRRCLIEADLAGESIYYGWAAGKERIEGPSIDCAMILVRNFGNVAVEAMPVQEVADAYLFTAAFIDLETGVTIQRQFRQSKRWAVYGKMDEFRKDDVRFQIGQSKAQRNVIIRAMPGWLLDAVMERAKLSVRASIQRALDAGNKGAVQDKATTELAKLGISRERVEQKYGKKIEAFDIDDWVMLSGDTRALRDGADTADVIFPVEATKPQSELGGIAGLEATILASKAAAATEPPSTTELSEEERQEKLAIAAYDKAQDVAAERKSKR